MICKKSAKEQAALVREIGKGKRKKIPINTNNITKNRAKGLARGVVFALSTFFLLSSLFIYVSAFQQKSMEFNKSFLWELSSDKFYYAFDSIEEGFKNLLNKNANLSIVVTDDTYREITISEGFPASKAEEFFNNVENWENFTEQKYSWFGRVDVKTDLSSELPIFIEPYNISINHTGDFGGDEITVTPHGNALSYMQGYNIVCRLIENNVSEHEDGNWAPNGDDGDFDVAVSVYGDKPETDIATSRSLNPYGSKAAVKLDFDNNGWLRVTFNRPNKPYGELFLEIKNAQCVLNTTLILDKLENTKVNLPEISIKLEDSKIEMEKFAAVNVI